MRESFRKLFGKVLGMKLRYRMLLLYFVGGALPMIVIGMYLISGTNRILVEQAKNAEVTEIEMVRQQTQELLSTATMVSKYFIFDEKLENIALKEYTDYQEMVNDYRNYSAFVQYGNYYNNIIFWISVYMENETIRGNAHFVKVDDEIRQQEWYTAAKEKLGGALWQYLPMSIGDYESLALTRLLRTKKGQDVGVLVLYIQQERLNDTIKTRDYDTMMVLNGETVVASHGAGGFALDKIREFLPEQDGNTHQKNITVDGEEYVLTCAGICPSETGDCIQVVSLRSYRDILSNADKQNRQSIIFFVCSAGLSFVMILAFSWSFGRRVGCFHEQMQRAAAGQFDLVEKLEGNDEISELYDYLGVMIREIRRLISEVYRERIQAEKLKSEQKNAEFKMLASQINPHFLYNTLETIRMMARVNGQYDIERLVKMLAKILRKNIQAGSQDVTLQTEIELIECYLEIQRYRFGERIQYHISVEEGLEQYQVFPLLMQPIVENSIIHGLEIKEGIGHISISIFRKKADAKVFGDGFRQSSSEQEKESDTPGNKDVVCIVIEDDGMGIEEETLKKLRENMDRETQDDTHIGVGNVHRRVRLRYGEAYGVRISSRRGEGTRVLILLPGGEKEKEDRQEVLTEGREEKTGNV